MIGHLQGLLTTGSRNGLGKTRFGGFFYGRMKSLVAGITSRSRGFLSQVEFRRRTFGDFCAQFQRAGSTFAGLFQYAGRRSIRAA